MNIYAKKGDKVIVTSATKGNGSSYDQDQVSKYLSIDQVYHVDKTDVGSWSTDVYLEEVTGEQFNSVMFEDYRPTPPVETKTAEETRFLELVNYDINWAKKEIAALPKVNDGTERAYFDGFILGCGKIKQRALKQFTRFTRSAKSVEVEEASMLLSVTKIAHKVQTGQILLINALGEAFELGEQKQAETISRLELALRKILGTPSKSDCDLIAKEVLTPTNKDTQNS